MPNRKYQWAHGNGVNFEGGSEAIKGGCEAYVAAAIVSGQRQQSGLRVLQELPHRLQTGSALIPRVTAALWAFPRYPFFTPDKT